MILGRFILRFLLVPLGIAAAALVGIAVIMIGEWNAFVAYVNSDQQSVEYVLADLAVDGTTRHDIRFLSASRFTASRKD